MKNYIFILIASLLLTFVTSCKKKVVTPNAQIVDTVSFDNITIEKRVAGVPGNYTIYYVSHSQYFTSKKAYFTHEVASYETYGYPNPNRTEYTEEVKIKKGETILVVIPNSLYEGDHYRIINLTMK